MFSVMTMIMDAWLGVENLLFKTMTRKKARGVHVDIGPFYRGASAFLFSLRSCAHIL